MTSTKKLNNAAWKLIAGTKENFEGSFGTSRDAVFCMSPSTLILLGDHTHYNDGILLSAATDSYAAIILKKREDRKINILYKDYFVAMDLEFSLSDNFSDDRNFEKIISLIKLFKDKFELTVGLDCAIEMNIPMSVGLGVSAALMTGLSYSINRAYNLHLAGETLVTYSRMAEYNVIGKISNSAHHFTSALSKPGKLTSVDLRDLSPSTLYDTKDRYKIVVCDTGEKIESPEAICNERIEECEVGIKGLRLYIWGIKNLRDVQLEFLQRHIHMIPQRIFNRILYNVQERIRVEQAVKLLHKNNFDDIGELIKNSHESLAREYELSTPKLDFLVDTSVKLTGVVGSKMISCSDFRSTYTIVESSYVNNFVKDLQEIYMAKYNDKLQFNILGINGGVRLISYKEIVLTV